jgi:hypothetical protein
MIKTNSYIIVDALFNLKENLMDVLINFCKFYGTDGTYEDFLKAVTKSDGTFSSRYLVREFKKLNHVTRQLMFESAKWCVETDYRVDQDLSSL